MDHMSYDPVEWDETVPISPANLSTMDEGIADADASAAVAQSTADGVGNDLAAHESATGDSAHPTMCRMVSGSYVGTGSAQVISLPFTPVFVVVSARGSTTDDGHFFSNISGTSGVRRSLAVSDENYRRSTAIVSIVTDGFEVGGFSGPRPIASKDGTTYDYVAFG